MEKARERERDVGVRKGGKVMGGGEEEKVGVRGKKGEKGKVREGGEVGVRERRLKEKREGMWK